MTLFRTLALALGIALVATPLLAQQRIYQRKDANGVSQYTDGRPESQYTVRNVNNSGTPAPTATPVAEENAQCKGVRNNLTRLQGSEAIGIDTNGDGKPDAWDTNGDGKADAWDTNGDGNPDAVDADGDGKPDAQ